MKRSVSEPAARSRREQRASVHFFTGNIQPYGRLSIIWLNENTSCQTSATPSSHYFVSCNTVWGHLMFTLKEAAERGGAPCPLFTKSGMDKLSAGGY